MRCGSVMSSTALLPRGSRGPERPLPLLPVGPRLAASAADAPAGRREDPLPSATGSSLGGGRQRPCDLGA